jgi:hypothetical protein
MPQTPGAPLPGTATGKVTVGRYVLTVGSPAGTILLPARRGESGEREALAKAFTAADAAERIEEAVEGAGSVADRIERAVELTTALAEGSLDRATALREAGTLLGWLGRLDREGRHRDALRLAKALIALLALLGRWADLVQSVRLALRAAQTIGDHVGEAWAHHELGSFSLAADDALAANSHLETAVEMRLGLGDAAGAQVSAHNLSLARTPPPPPTRWGRILAIAGVAALLVGGTTAGIVLARDDGDDVVVTTLEPTTDETPNGTTNDGPTTVETPLPTAEILDGPLGLTNDRDATFVFTADREVAGFTCRLDDGESEACASPHRYAALQDGEYFFTVLPTAPDGRSGAPAERAWTVDATPPVTTIETVEVGSNEATVVFLAGEDATFECSLDHAEPATCQSPFTLTDLASGTGYAFAVRGTDEAGNEGDEASTRFVTPPSSVD